MNKIGGNMELQVLRSVKFWGLLTTMLVTSTQSQAMGYSSDYSTCMNSAGMSSGNVASCMKSEFSYQNGRVKDNFKVSLALYSDAEKKNQKAFQKQWKKLRATNCRKESSSDSVERQTRYLNCALKMTVTRADLLEKQLYRLK